MALAAMAQAKQDTAVLRHLAKGEADALEAERLYLGRWRNQLHYLSEAIEKEAVEAIVGVRHQRTH